MAKQIVASPVIRLRLSCKALPKCISITPLNRRDPIIFECIDYIARNCFCFIIEESKKDRISMTCSLTRFTGI
ncbi:hypothetical protein BGC31_09655 [Komagataeibacter xylinus]|nr:hypothetical protein BFX83_10990 [Komagataeibacter xylinus]RFO99649.1 hypothetical protein BGC31_09655 [Komagataeibacter xylinus]